MASDDGLEVVFPAETWLEFASRDPGNGIQRPAIVRGADGDLHPVIGCVLVYGTFLEIGETPFQRDEGDAE